MCDRHRASRQNSGGVPIARQSGFFYLELLAALTLAALTLALMLDIHPRITASLTRTGRRFAERLELNRGDVGALDQDGCRAAAYGLGFTRYECDNAEPTAHDGPTFLVEDE